MILTAGCALQGCECTLAVLGLTGGDADSCVQPGNALHCWDVDTSILRKLAAMIVIYRTSVGYVSDTYV